MIGDILKFDEVISLGINFVKLKDFWMPHSFAFFSKEGEDIQNEDINGFELIKTVIEGAVKLVKRAYQEIHNLITLSNVSNVYNRH